MSVRPSATMPPSSHKTARSDPATGSEIDTVVRMESKLLGEVLAAVRELMRLQTELPMVLSLEDAAKQLGDMSVPTLKRMIRDGEIDAVSLRKRVGIPRSEIERIARGEPSPRSLKTASALPRSPRARKQAAAAVAGRLRDVSKKF